MERIDTQIMPAAVDIDGAEYAVAANTVGVTEELIAARRRCAGLPEYRLWLAELQILLGRGAVKRLFRNGRRENVDRIQRIHAGVCRAFEQNADEVERRRAADRAEIWGEAAAVLEPINALLRQMERAEVREIRREDVRREAE